MTFHQRILLDRLLAVPLAVVLNALVRILGHLLHRDHSVNPSATRRIVVCKLVGMGSILQATPLLRALKQQFPQARLTFVTLRGNAGLVPLLEEIDEALYLDDRGALPMLGTTAKVLWNLISCRVDHFFDLEIYSGFTCLLSLFSLARNRLGFYRHSNRFKKGIYTHLVYFNTRMPIRKIYLQLGGAAGASMENDTLSSIRIDPAERQSMREKLSSLGLKEGQSYLLINPNASDLLRERRWPKEYFKEAIEGLTQKGFNVVLMGAKSEADFTSSLVEMLPQSVRCRVFNTAGMLSMGELFALIEKAQCVLTNDTGPMHIVFALQRPVVCLVGPADPIHYGIEGPGVVTLYAPVPCSPCIYEVDSPPCGGDNICMRRLLPRLVLDHLLALLAPGECVGGEGSSVGDHGVIRLPLVWQNTQGQPLGVVVRSSLPTCK
ncbi:MAG: glycosyltransferase family 9 protein [Verrucomicrobiota bacterium]